MSWPVTIRLLGALLVAIPFLCRDAGPLAPVAAAHLGPLEPPHSALARLLPDFRAARDMLDRSRLLMSKLDASKQWVMPRPALQPAPAAQLQVLSRIEDSVMDIRGLQKKSDIAMELLDRDGLRDYLVAVVSDSGADRLQADYLKLLRVLGLTPRDDVSVDALVETLADRILGFYSPEGKYMVLINSAGTMGGGEQATYAHEFTHALQDQHFDLGQLMSSADSAQDHAAALRALVEGDATYAQVRWAMSSLSSSELWELLYGEVIPTSRSRPSIDQMATAMGSATFTYGRGMNFVHHLHNVGGYEAVNQAFAHPPTTTEQIMHPEKYLSGEGAIPVDLPDPVVLLGPGWNRVITDSLGMLGIGGLINEFSDDRAATRVAEGWGGDKFSLLEHNDGRLAFVIRTVWDTERDAVEFQNAMSESQRNRFQMTLPALQRFSSWQLLGAAEYSALVTRAGSEVLVAITSDELTAVQVAGRLGFQRPA